jgi:hypothetical protein
MTGSAVTLTGSEHTIPGGTIAAGHCLAVDTFFTVSGGGPTVDFKVVFGGATPFVIWGALSDTTWPVHLVFQICNKLGLTNAQQWDLLNISKGDSVWHATPSWNTSTVDTAADVVLKLTGTGSYTATLLAMKLKVE